jgi:hypothetical protein
MMRECRVIRSGQGELLDLSELRYSPVLPAEVGRYGERRDGPPTTRQADSGLGEPPPTGLAGVEVVVRVEAPEVPLCVGRAAASNRSLMVALSFGEKGGRIELPTALVRERS